MSEHRAERFDRARDLDEIQRWCDGWGMARFPDYWLPATGFIVRGVVAAFLYRTDSGVAYMECVISNPASPKPVRREALDRVTEAIVAEASAAGFQMLIGASNNPSVLATAERHTFKVVEKPHHFLLRSLP